MMGNEFPNNPLRSFLNFPFLSSFHQFSPVNLATAPGCGTRTAELASGAALSWRLAGADGRVQSECKVSARRLDATARPSLPPMSAHEARAKAVQHPPPPHFEIQATEQHHCVRSMSIYRVEDGRNHVHVSSNN
ncbi:hypothetical protein HHI36_004058 [Cryptolaemus montrouzieri]|uniref:Uncharacterized protein n=1 Tax=Cryptolaemus montrouzieri TaxID=559131 RepID=A0ABD2NQW2_9CUCU